MFQIEKALIRWILNSNGGYAIEADVFFTEGYWGRASSPAAILAGRREKKVTADIKNRIDFYNAQIKILTGKKYTQASWDQILGEHMAEWGSDVTLALSLAFSRAASLKETSLVRYLRSLYRAEAKEKPFRALIPIFSGGVHDAALNGSMQQIMVSIEKDNFPDTVETILNFYSYIENKLISTEKLKGYSASSGFLTKNLELEDKFFIITDTIHKFQMEDSISIAIDVAAEHLKRDTNYQFHGQFLLPCKLEEILSMLVEKYPITYVEDPFDMQDKKNWESFYKKCGSKAKIFSDDLSATQVQYLDNSLSDGVIVKMKQVGTLTGTLAMIEAAQKADMLTCVSHRSLETEDTFMCDLGVAIHADYMKIGGPRRGDRVEKYNQLLRLWEEEQNG